MDKSYVRNNYYSDIQKSSVQIVFGIICWNAMFGILESISALNLYGLLSLPAIALISGLMDLIINSRPYTIEYDSEDISVSIMGEVYSCKLKEIKLITLRFQVESR